MFELDVLGHRTFSSIALIATWCWTYIIPLYLISTSSNSFLVLVIWFLFLFLVICNHICQLFLLLQRFSQLLIENVILIWQFWYLWAIELKSLLHITLKFINGDNLPFRFLSLGRLRRLGLPTRTGCWLPNQLEIWTTLHLSEKIIIITSTFFV